MSKRRGELFRNPSRGKIAGVCAGVADYFGWEIWLVRILVVSGVLFGMPFLILVYVAAWFILDKDPSSAAFVKGKRGQNVSGYDRTKSSEDELASESIKVKARVWQSGEPPKQAFHDIRRKFRTLEHKLQNLEKYVTSTEFTVSREINKL